MIIMVATMMTRQVDENDFAVEDEHSPIICRTSLESQASSSLCEVRQTEPTQLQLPTDQVRTQNRLPIRLPLHIAIKVIVMMKYITTLVFLLYSFSISYSDKAGIGIEAIQLIESPLPILIMV